MAYDKPKVTIDLEEYENLKQGMADLQNQSKESDISMYKKVISEAIRSAGRADYFTANLAREGISVQILQHLNGKMSEDWERIFVTKIPK